MQALAAAGLAWHDFSNSDFHCWSDSASDSNQDVMDCHGKA